MSEHRIVSLLPSSTEIVCALGFKDQLVGRSHECDYPVDVQSRAICSEPKISIEGSSAEVDIRVREVLEKALSIYAIDVDTLKNVAPTVIVTQDHCEVCAVSIKDVEIAACEVLPGNPKIVSLSPNSLGDVYNDIKKVGAALEATNKANALIMSMQQEMAAIKAKAVTADQLPRVAFVEWIDPLWTGGNWMPELVDAAGGINVFGTNDTGTHSHATDFGTLTTADADIICIAPCGYDIPKAIAEMSPLVTHPEWNNLRAVQSGNVFIADGNQFFNRPGPRLTDSVRILAEVFHPSLFGNEHEGNNGWIRWNNQ